MRIAKSPVAFWTRALPLASLLFAIGCAMSAVIDYDAAVNFKAYERFAWLSEQQEQTGNVRIDNPLVDKRIRSAMDDEFTRKGYTKSDSQAADFLIGYHIALDRRLDLQTINSHYGYGRYGRYGMGPDVIVRDYEEGTMLLDIVDARSNQLVWRSSYSTRLRGEPTPARREAIVREAVQVLLEDFPPEPARD